MECFVCGKEFDPTENSEIRSHRDKSVDMYCPHCGAHYIASEYTGVKLMNPKTAEANVAKRHAQVSRQSPTYYEINNIIALAKADDTVKKELLDAVSEEFWDDLESQFREYYASQGMLRRNY